VLKSYIFRGTKIDCMRKLFLVLIVIAFILITFVLYSFLSPRSTTLLTGENGESFELPFEIPFISSESEEETTTPQGAGGMGTAGEEGIGSGGEAPSGPKVNYTLNIDSIPSDLTIYVEYYVNNTLFNTTQITPFSLEIEEGTTACVVEVTGYEGIFWLLDEIGCEFVDCGEHEWGCSMFMDGSHVATLRQYS
jgi:hypothetical protein